jgi:hypothetical protein
MSNRLSNGDGDAEGGAPYSPGVRSWFRSLFTGDRLVSELVSVAFSTAFLWLLAVLTDAPTSALVLTGVVVMALGSAALIARQERAKALLGVTVARDTGAREQSEIPLDPTWTALRESDAAEIRSLVFVRYRSANTDNLSLPAPYVDFQFTYFNASVLAVELDSFSGRLAGRDGPFAQPPEQTHKLDASPRFGHGQHYNFRLRQYLTPEEAATIVGHDDPPYFETNAHFEVLFTLPERPDLGQIRIDIHGGQMPWA